jgi:hypothetical protein
MRHITMPVRRTGVSPVILVLLTAPIVAVVAGCGPAVEKNASFKAAVIQVERIDEDLKMGLNRLGRLDNSLDSLNTQINKLHRKWERVSPDKQASLEQRLAGIEQSLKTNLNTMAALNKRLDAMDQENWNQQVALKKQKIPPIQKITRLRSEKKATPKKVSKAEVSPRVQRPKQPRTSGFYYTLKKGESILDVATRHKTTASALQDINRFPKGRRVMAGTEIYIPQK